MTFSQAEEPAFATSVSLSFTGCSAARLAHLLWEQGVVSSNLPTPTKQKMTGHLVVPGFFIGSESVKSMLLNANLIQ